MRQNGLTALILIASLAAALLGWSFARSKTRKTVVHTVNEPVVKHDATLILPGILMPAITTPIAVGNLNLVVDLNTHVQQGEVIGVAPSQIAPAEVEQTRSELANARFCVAQAEENLRQINEELSARRAQLSSMNSQEMSAETGDLEAEREFERRETLFRSGLASEIDYDAAGEARASAAAALASLRSNIAATEVEADEWEVKAEEAQTKLAEASERAHAAQALAESMQGRRKAEPVLSPADGIIVASGDPAGTGFGIASDPSQLCVYAELPQADVMSVRVGQEALIVLKGEPAVTLKAKVSALPQTPVDSPEGVTYPLILSVENPARTWLAGVAVRVRIERSFR
jgi:multidrug resistance efflux pump